MSIVSFVRNTNSIKNYSGIGDQDKFWRFMEEEQQIIKELTPRLRCIDFGLLSCVSIHINFC